MLAICHYLKLTAQTSKVRLGIVLKEMRLVARRSQSSQDVSHLDLGTVECNLIYAKKYEIRCAKPSFIKPSQ